MNSLFDEDDRDEPKSDADLTLGIGSLLSIFFGVLIICGIFFAFGYTMGRRNTHATTTLVPGSKSPTSLVILLKKPKGHGTYSPKGTR